MSITIPQSSGIKLVKASNTLRHSFDTERGGVSVTLALLMKLIPNFSGTVRISYESKDSALAAVNMQLGLCAAPSAGGNGGDWSIGKLLDLPLGSEVSSLAASYLLVSGAPSNTASYVTRYIDVNVSAGEPLMLYAMLNGTRYFQNIRVYYDFVTSAEEGV